MRRATVISPLRRWVALGYDRVTSVAANRRRALTFGGTNFWLSWRSRTCTSPSRTAPRSSRVSTSAWPRTRCTRSWARTAPASRRSPTRSWVTRPTRSPRGRSSSTARTSTELGADERAQRGLFLAFQYPHAIPGVTVTNFLRSAINAIRKARDGGEDDPVPIPEFRKELLAAMERLEGLARAGVALPQRRVLRRREEARRDPADGDAEAEDRRPRRDRLRARHRRAADRRRAASTSSSARRWARC